MVRLLTPAAFASCPMLTSPAVSSTIFAAIPVTPCWHPEPRLPRRTVTTPERPSAAPAAGPDTSRVVAVWILSKHDNPEGILGPADLRRHVYLVRRQPGKPPS